MARTCHPPGYNRGSDFKVNSLDEMIKDVRVWTAWETQGPLREPLDFHSNLKLLESMYELARLLGALPPEDPLAGLETDIRVARILNVSGAAGQTGPRP